MKIILFAFLVLLVGVGAQGQILDSYKYPGKLSPIPSYYGVSVIQYQPFVPFQVGRGCCGEGSLVWYSPSEPVYGVRITEYGEFFLNKIFPAFVNESSRPEYLDYIKSDAMFDYYRRTKGQPTVSLAPSPASSYIEYYRSNEFSKFYMALLYLNSDNSALGLGFGSSRIRNMAFRNGTDGYPVGDFATQLARFTPNSWVDDGGGYIHFDGIVSWNLDTKLLGSLKFTHNISAQSVLGVNESLRTMMQTMGMWSSLGLSATRSLGPIRFGAQAVAPTRWVIVPVYYKATSLAFSAGLAF